MTRAPTATKSSGISDALLLFDGDCGFCTTAVNWLAARLPAFPEAAPFQWTDLDAIGMTMDEAAARVWLITPHRQYGGHLAVSALLRAQRATGWRFLGWLLITPPFSLAAAAGYALVAKYRHRLPGGTPACQVGARR